MDLVPDLLIADRFRLVRQLGQGGMGAVWVAHHVELDVNCAIKFIEASFASNAEFRMRFVREARAAAQIRSPHVVNVLDSGVWNGLPYLAMELMEGQDLGHRIEEIKRLPPAETVDIVQQVARALTKAHAAGFVHRDLKPDNIFLIKDEDRLLAKVLDFGIAKQLSDTGVEGGTRAGALLGTPYYMSPEQALGNKSVDARSDLWSLAVIAFECLTGTKPFDSTGLGELLMMIQSGPIPSPSQIAPWLPPTFEAWWQRAMTRDPAGRFQTARELADALAVSLNLSAAGFHDASMVASSGEQYGLPRSSGTGPAGTMIPVTPVGMMGQGAPSSSAVTPPKSKMGPVLVIGGLLLAGGAVTAFFLTRPSTTTVDKKKEKEVGRDAKVTLPPSKSAAENPTAPTAEKPPPETPPERPGNQQGGRRHPQQGGDKRGGGMQGLGG